MHRNKPNQARIGNLESFANRKRLKEIGRECANSAGYACKSQRARATRSKADG